MLLDLLNGLADDRGLLDFPGGRESVRGGNGGGDGGGDRGGERGSEGGGSVSAVGGSVDSVVQGLTVSVGKGSILGAASSNNSGQDDLEGKK